jgi:aspartate 1-decarboxylase
VNGAAARKVLAGDILLIMAFATMDLQEAKSFHPNS